MTSHPNPTVVRAIDVFKRRKPVAGTIQQGKIAHLSADKREVPPAAITEETPLEHHKIQMNQLHATKRTKSFEQQVMTMFDPRRFGSCYRCFEVQYLLYLSFRDMVSTFKTQNAVMNMPWGSAPTKSQLTALRRVMRRNLSKLADECFADARKLFSKTAYAAAAPIYEIHEATGFCLERLTDAARCCNKLLVDQKEQSASLIQLAQQIDKNVDELTAENSQLEDRLQYILNN